MGKAIVVVHEQRLAALDSANMGSIGAISLANHDRPTGWGMFSGSADLDAHVDVAQAAGFGHYHVLGARFHLGTLALDTAI
jgi:hypothetical protein